MILATAALICLAAPIAHAEDGASTAPVATVAAFPKDTETFSLTAAYQNERTGKDRRLSMIGAGWGKYFFDNVAAEFQIVGYQAHDDEDALGIGGNVLGRWHFLNFGAVSFYGDVLGGFLVTSDDFPTGGTCLNFTYAGGPGMDVRLGEGVYLDFGVRFQHVSNGFIEGRDRNPIFNSFGGYVGVMWTH